MKIGTKAPLTVRFDHLESGDVFRLGGELWLLCNPEGTDVNCVRLRDGLLSHLECDRPVEPVKGHFEEAIGE